MSNYAQIPTNLICRFGELTKTEIVVVSYLYAARNRKTGQCNPSRSAIARAVQVDRAHVGRAVQNLEEIGWIVEMPGGNFELISEPKVIAKSATRPVAKSAQGGVRNPQHDVAESATDPCEIRNTHIKESSEQRNEQKNEQKKNVVAIATRTDPHSVLMRHHANRIETITDGGAQGKAIKSILQNFSVEEAIGCYEYQVSELKGAPGGWRGSVNWLTVLKYLPEWKTAGRPVSAVKNNGTHSSNRAEQAVTKHNIIAGVRARVAARNISGSNVADSS